jgi:hypothetical protein
MAALLITSGSRKKLEARDLFEHRVIGRGQAPYNRLHGIRFATAKADAEVLLAPDDCNGVMMPPREKNLPFHTKDESKRQLAKQANHIDFGSKSRSGVWSAISPGPSTLQARQDLTCNNEEGLLEVCAAPMSSSPPTFDPLTSPRLLKEGLHGSCERARHEEGYDGDDPLASAGHRRCKPGGGLFA